MQKKDLRRSGVAELLLASGPVPHYKEIVKLSGPVMSVLVNEFGTKEVIKRFSDPLWLHCYACAVGFEWQYSGMGTVPIMAAKEALEKENLGIKIVGGKGRKSKAIEQIPKVSEELNLSTSKTKIIDHASRLTCKVDTCEIQDAHQLYFHSMLIDEKGDYVTINQKMNTEYGTVRRFHWVPNPECFEENPHSGAVGSRKEVTMNLISRDSEECRKTIVDVVQDQKPEKIQQTILSLDRKLGQTTLIEFMKNETRVIKLPYHLRIPRKLNLGALKIAHELTSNNFEELLGVKGIGPATIRGLAYLSDLIYGTKNSFKDPIKYTFAFGTKVNIPYPVEKQAMCEAAEILKSAVEEAKIGSMEKMKALRRLKGFIM